MPLPTLKNQRLVLRPFTLADAPTVQKLGSAYDVASKTLSIPHPYPDGMAEAWIATHEPDWDNKTWITLALTLKKDDTEPQDIMSALFEDEAEEASEGEPDITPPKKRHKKT